MTREQFEQLKSDVAQLSNVLAEIGDLEGFSAQQTRAEEAVACSERIHKTLSESSGFRHRIQGGPTTQ